jgi:hypothetical protein
MTRKGFKIDCAASLRAAQKNAGLFAMTGYGCQFGMKSTGAVDLFAMTGFGGHSIMKSAGAVERPVKLTV